MLPGGIKDDKIRCQMIKKVQRFRTSSSNKTLGFLTNALASAILCFCPPLIIPPRSPTTVSYPSGNFVMKSCALASLQASMI